MTPSTSYSTKEAAEFLGVSVKTLLRKVREGKIDAWRASPGGPLHFEAAEIEAFKERNSVGQP